MKHIINTRTQLGAILKSIRKDKGMTQEDIFKKVGLHQKTVSFLESGKPKSTIKTLMLYLTAIEYDIVLVPKNDNKKQVEW